MSSESDSEESRTSENSELCNFVSVDVEEQSTLSDEVCREVGNNVVVAPYTDEPLANEEWIQQYQLDKQKEQIRRLDLQNRLDQVVSTNSWCKCGNCDVTLLQNVYEAQCCKEVEGCARALCSDEVLQDVKTVPSCITLHPGFRAVCLEKWSLRLAASKYKTKDRIKYRQSGLEETFLRSVSYREFCRLVYHGYLGKVRIPLPACAYAAIRTKFKGEGEEMIGFEDD